MPKSTMGSLLRTGVLATLLEDIDVTKSSEIHVTGSSALSVLLWLCSHNYEHVAYVRAASEQFDLQADALIVAHTCGELELKHFLPIGRCVRPHGVLIFQLKADPHQSPAGLSWLLASEGFSPICRIEGERRTLFVARRLPSSLLRAA